MAYTMNYLFVDGRSDRPAYQILSNGDLLKFAPGCYQAPIGSVAISLGDVKSLLKDPLGRDTLVERCEKLFVKRCNSRVVPDFIKGEDEVKLSELFDEARSFLK